jgi:hypothetical protein
MLKEEAVVQLINQWRIREMEEQDSESDGSGSDDDLGFDQLRCSKKDIPLKRDNVATDEVVDIINKLREGDS